MYLLIVWHLAIAPPVYQEFDTLQGCEKVRAFMEKSIKDTYKSADAAKIVACVKKD